MSKLEPGQGEGRPGRKADGEQQRAREQASGEQDTKWFSTKPVIGNSGAMELPIGPWCWGCGTALEVWPLEPAAIIADKVRRDTAFQREFLQVRAGVEHAFTRLTRRETVESVRSSGCRMYFPAIFVSLESFELHFQMPVARAAGSKLKIVQLDTPEGGLMEGVLLAPDTPGLSASGVSHYILEIYHDTKVVHTDTAMHESEILRSGQGADYFTHALSKMLEVRPAALKQASWPKLPSYEAVSGMVQEKKAELELKEAQQAQRATATQQAAEAGSTAVSPGIAQLGEVRSSSRLGGVFFSAGNLGGKGGPAGRPAGGSAAPGTPRPPGRRVAPYSAGRPAPGTPANYMHSQTPAGRPAGGSAGGPSPSGKLILSLDTPMKKDNSLDVRRILEGWSAGRELNGATHCSNVLCLVLCIVWLLLLLSCILLFL